MKMLMIAIIAISIAATASAHSLLNDLDEDLHAGPLVSVSYMDAREKYGYPPYATQYFTGYQAD